MSTLRNAPERLQRLLVMLPWLMEVGEAPLAEVARRFDMTEADVERNLELVAMCGLPPFIDEMIDVFVDDGTVFVGVPRLFTRPLRLTAPEGFALLAAGRAAMELPGADPDGPLGRGLAKLATTLDHAGVDSAGVERSASDAAGVAFDLDRPAFTDALVELTAQGSQIAIAYFSAGRDELTERTIVPRHVFVDAGRWYVLADDDRSGSRRTFRIDRIERWEPTGLVVPTDEHVLAPAEFFTDAELPRAVLRLAPAAHWVSEQYPVDDVIELTDPSGWIEVRLAVASDRWLSRLLIRLGPHARVVSPESASAQAGALAATMLARYAN
jgi:proteasome accessory factor C